MRVLLTWIGAQDPWIRPGGRIVGKLQPFPPSRPEDASDGPILSFVAHSQPFDVVYFLFDPSIAATEADDRLKSEFNLRYPRIHAEFRYIGIDDPRSYDGLYTHMLAVCEEVAANHGPKADYNIFLSPGTPQMHAVWILLSKTRFLANTWQGSDRGGAKAELVKLPFDLYAELSEARHRTASLEIPVNIPGLVIASESMRQLVENIRSAAPWRQAILLLGETGTGKTRIAGLAHELGSRRDRPFVTVECNSIPSSLIESELFGHVRGAFTGADRAAEGRFRAAQGGTLFLDEIGDLPLDLQGKLLRVLQERRLTPLGSSREESIDVRVVAATNRDLPQLIADGKFREDLYYRLSTFVFTVPPLRHRREDIQPLTNHFLDVVNAERKSLARPPLRFLPAANRFLEQYDWPGNVRQLESAVTHLAALRRDHRVPREAIEEAAERTRGVTKGSNGRTMSVEIDLDRGIRQILRDVEEKVLGSALAIARVSEKLCKWESRGGLLNPRRPHEHGTQDPIPIL